MNRVIRKVAVGAAIAATSVICLAGTAQAGRPATQGCVGSTLSSLASDQSFPGQFGAGVRSFAQSPGKPGLGDGIQALQAGVVPDGTLPNTCNG